MTLEYPLIFHLNTSSKMEVCEGLVLNQLLKPQGGRFTQIKLDFFPPLSKADQDQTTEFLHFESFYDDVDHYDSSPIPNTPRKNRVEHTL